MKQTLFKTKEYSRKQKGKFVLLPSAHLQFVCDENRMLDSNLYQNCRLKKTIFCTKSEGTLRIYNIKIP